MNIYLDQNKWIELARIVNGKDRGARAAAIVREFDAAILPGHVCCPLSAIHFMETARIRDPKRRSRLGSTMWRYSRGYTVAAYPSVVYHELEVALSRQFPVIHPRSFDLISRGHFHAFGISDQPGRRTFLDELVERAMLVGDDKLNVEPIAWQYITSQERFRDHLSSIESTKKGLPKNKWDDWLYAMLITDIRRPLAEILHAHGIPLEAIEHLQADGLRAIVDDMPTRRLDLHLHRQILRNSQYRAKTTDLEDWTGVGAASCYFDVVVCEKHMADMLRRDGYQTRARIEADLANTFLSLKG